MSEYELVKKLGSYNNFKGPKSMAKVPRHKLFARNKLSAPTVDGAISYYCTVNGSEKVRQSFSFTIYSLCTGDPSKFGF